MPQTIYQSKSNISVGCIEISNLRLDDDIALIAGINEDLQTLTKQLVSASIKYGMEIRNEKGKYDE